MSEDIVDWTKFNAARAELGMEFVRILGYFHEDGVKSIGKVETALRAHRAVDMILPAHTLKGESAQFGAVPLERIAEHIEKVARNCVERHEEPDELIEWVVKLRPMFDKTMAEFERETNPLVQRRARGFGKRSEAANQGFGQI